MKKLFILLVLMGLIVGCSAPTPPKDDVVVEPQPTEPEPTPSPQPAPEPTEPEPIPDEPAQEVQLDATELLEIVDRIDWVTSIEEGLFEQSTDYIETAKIVDSNNITYELIDYVLYATFDRNKLSEAIRVLSTLVAEDVSSMEEEITAKIDDQNSYDFNTQFLRVHSENGQDIMIDIKIHGDSRDNEVFNRLIKAFGNEEYDFIQERSIPLNNNFVMNSTLNRTKEFPELVHYNAELFYDGKDGSTLEEDREVGKIIFDEFVNGLFNVEMIGQDREHILSVFLEGMGNHIASETIQMASQFPFDYTLTKDQENNTVKMVFDGWYDNTLGIVDPPTQ